MNIRNAVQFSTVAMVLAGGTSLMAQVTTGALSGHVMDTNGKPLANARVALESPALFQPRILKTDANGQYRAQLLPVGNYVIRVSADNYMGKSAEGVRVGVGTNLSLDFSLKAVKDQSATIEVVASMASESKTDDKVSTNYSNDELLKLPTTLNFNGAATLTAGVAGTGADLSIRGGSGGGQGQGHNGGYSQVLYRIDGIDVQNSAVGTVGGDMPTRTTLYEPLPDSIADIQVVVAALNARNGRSQGGQVNVVTKSGSNEFEGSVRAYIDRPSWTGNLPGGLSQGESDLEAGRGEAYSRYMDVTLSGPIIKDRLWFYLGTRIQPNSQGTAQLGYTGEPFGYKGSATGARNIVSDIMKYPMITWGRYSNIDTALTTQAGLNQAIGNSNYTFYDRSKTDWLNTIAADNTLKHYEGKLTGQINANNTVSGTYLYSKETNGGYIGERTFPPLYTNYANMAGSIATTVKAYTINWNSTLSEKWFLEAKASKAETRIADVVGPTDYAEFVQTSMSSGTDLSVGIDTTNSSQSAGSGGRDHFMNVFYSRRSSSNPTPNLQGNKSYFLNLKTFQEGAGQHEIDFGGEFFQTEFNAGRERANNEGIFQGGLVENPDVSESDRNKYLYPVFYATGDPWMLTQTDGAFDNSEVPGQDRMRGPSAHVERYQSSSQNAVNNSTGLWVNDTWSINEHWNVMVGVRYNKFVLKDTWQKELANVGITEPRFQLKWNPDGKEREIYSLSIAKLASQYSDEMASYIRSNSWMTRTVHTWTGAALPGGQLPINDGTEGGNAANIRFVTYDQLIDKGNYGEAQQVVAMDQTLDMKGLSVPYAYEYTLGYTRNYDTGFVRVNLVQRTYQKEWVVFVHDGYYDHTNPARYLTLVTDPSNTITRAEDIQQWHTTNRFLNSGFDRIYRGIELSWNENITSRVNFGGNYSWSQETGRNSVDYYNLRDEKLKLGLPENVWAPQGTLARNQNLNAYLTYTHPVGKGHVAASLLATWNQSGVNSLAGSGSLATAGVLDTTGTDGNGGGYALGHKLDIYDGAEEWQQNSALAYSKYYSGLGAFSGGLDTYKVDCKLAAEFPLVGKVVLSTYVQISNLFNRVQRTGFYDWKAGGGGSAGGAGGGGGELGGDGTASTPIDGRALAKFALPWGYTQGHLDYNYGAQQSTHDNYYYTGGRAYTQFSIGLKF